MSFIIEKSEETIFEFLQNLQQENGMLSMIKITQTNYGEGMKIVQPLNLKPKSLN